MIEFTYIWITELVLLLIAAIVLYITGNKVVFFAIGAMALIIVAVYGYYDIQESERGERVYSNELPLIKNKINQSQSTSDTELFTRIETYCDLYSSNPIKCKRDLKKEYFNLS